MMAKKNHDGYWKNIENALVEARKVKEKYELEKLPTPSKLSKLGYSSLTAAISSYHGGFYEFRKKLGEELSQVKRNSWMDLAFTIEELKKIMREHALSDVPSKVWLVNNGYSSIPCAIDRYHGGFRNIRTVLGEEQKQRENGSRNDLDVVLNEAREIMKLHGFTTFPSQMKLRKMGYSGLTAAISKYHGGMHTFREALGVEPQEVRKGTWKNLEYTIGKAREAMEKLHADYLPPQVILAKNGYSMLSAAILKYHGGFFKFRALLDQRMGIKSSKEQLDGLVNGYLGESK